MSKESIREIYIYIHLLTETSGLNSSLKEKKIEDL